MSSAVLDFLSRRELIHQFMHTKLLHLGPQQSGEGVFGYAILHQNELLSVDRVYGHGISYCITVNTKESDQELHPKSSYYVFYNSLRKLKTNIHLDQL